MNARRSLTALLAAAGATASLLLAGCEPATGQQGNTSSSGGLADCDPNGFGPLSGCDSADTTEQVAEPATPTGSCNPPGCGLTQDELDDIADRFPKGTTADLSACEDGQSPECSAQLDAWADQFERDVKDAFSLGTAPPGTDWVVESVQNRDGNYVTVCVARGDLSPDPSVDSDRFWKEVDLSQVAAGSLHRGDACPRGGTIFDDGPIRPDGAS